MNLPKNFKQDVSTALLAVRPNYSGSDAAFAKQWGINGSVFSRIRKGETEGILRDAQWLTIGRQLNISMNQREWKAAKTEVFTIIEEDIDFCQTHGKSKMFVDDCGIGKTFTAKYLARTRKNCFYIDASQCKTRHLFTRALAKAIGVDAAGKLAEVKEDIKYYLKTLPQPIIIIDEAGDLDRPAFLDLKEYWNATENACAWYMMGAEGFREFIRRGMKSKKVGFREIFSRFSERYTSVVPTDLQEKQSFYKQLITDVLKVNAPDNSQLNEIIRKCLTKDEDNRIGGLRRAESLLILHS
ncbi:ATP-binding protein [Sphingobacterium psychroaquaticum]|uniref:ORC1/DEAH AAA+ ATPase domain-containing protein n=1 Tax=Sphingobacterium psychroaquaticum TaxID=561061 RepID=A0A1X7K4Z5_9SPHI|nr:ATP-binding protein [Sphingobacterium psychroaquaticum]SMG35807.1 hypothetical protein SAMN05660862_2551 [Sphingobacterium psychroaquaticum]